MDPDGAADRLTGVFPAVTLSALRVNAWTSSTTSCCFLPPSVRLAGRVKVAGATGGADSNYLTRSQRVERWKQSPINGQKRHKLITLADLAICLQQPARIDACSAHFTYLEGDEKKIRWFERTEAVWSQTSERPCTLYDITKGLRCTIEWCD